MVFKTYRNLYPVFDENNPYQWPYILTFGVHPDVSKVLPLRNEYFAAWQTEVVDLGLSKQFSEDLEITPTDAEEPEDYGPLF